MDEGAVAVIGVVDGAPVADARAHRLTPDVIGLPQSVLIGVATSAPGQSTVVALAPMVAAVAYATGPAILLSMLPMLAIALCYQRLNLWEQNCGGPYVWVGRSISPFVGYLVAWAMLVGFVLGSVSDILPLGPALLSLGGWNASGVVGNVLTVVVFGAVITGVAAVGLRTTARFQLGIAAVEYTILAVFSAIAFWAVFVGHWPGTVHPTAAWLRPSGVGGKGSLSAGMLIAVFLFTGWDASMYINEETRQKRRNPGRAVLISVAILGVVYTWLFVTFQGVVPPAQLAAHTTDALPYLATALVGSGWAKLMVLAVVLSVVATSQTTLVALSRVSYSMGSDHLLPSSFGRVNRRLRTPAWAAVFWGAVMVAVAVGYAASASLATAFGDVINLEAVPFTFFFIFTALATTWYYRRLLRRSPLDLVLVGVCPLAAAAVLSWVLEQSVTTLTPPTPWILLGLAVTGLVLMVISRFVFRAPFFGIGQSSWRPTADGSPDPVAADR